MTSFQLLSRVLKCVDSTLENQRADAVLTEGESGRDEVGGV